MSLEGIIFQFEVAMIARGKTQLGGRISHFPGGRPCGALGSYWANLCNFPGEHWASHPARIYEISPGNIV